MSAKIERVRPPTEFVEQALELEVPWKGQPNLPDHSLQCIIEMLERSLKDTSSRTEQIEQLARRVTKLRGEEQGARRHLHPSVSRVTAGKSTVAMKELLEELGYHDSSVCDLIREGFELVGDFEHCPVFDTKPEEEDYQGADPEWLRLKAAEIRADLEAQHSRTKNDFITEAVWEETDGALNPESETAKGWLEGPFTPEGITERLGTTDWAPCHRFGVDQGKKIRTIDNLSRNFTNACFYTG